MSATPLSQDKKQTYDIHDAADQDDKNKPVVTEEMKKNLGGMIRLSLEYGRGHKFHLFFGTIGVEKHKKDTLVTI